jgi:hypothetical protein
MRKQHLFLPGPKTDKGMPNKDAMKVASLLFIIFLVSVKGSYA